jgi:phosphatidate cytidylyltransferase
MAAMAARNLLLRIVSAAVGLPLLGLLVFWDEPWGFGLLALLVVALALLEYGALTLGSAHPGTGAVLVATGTSFATAIYLRPAETLLWAMAAVVLQSTWLLLGHRRAGDLSAATHQLGMAGFGIFYIGGLVMALPLMHRDLVQGPLWVTTALAVSFANDTGAYFVGRALGRHKLAPQISPGKTIEGAVGGLIVGVVFMFLARATFFPALSSTDVLAVGLATGILGPAGDLLESMIKRAAGAKDSGRLIPGHGGILDRIDAVLFVAPFVYAYARYLR